MLSGLVNPGGERALIPKTPPEHLELLKATVRSALSLGDDAAVLVQQLACMEQDCPPVETVVAVLDTPLCRTWKFADAAVAVDVSRVHAALLAHPEGQEHDHQDR